MAKKICLLSKLRVGTFALAAPLACAFVAETHEGVAWL